MTTHIDSNKKDDKIPEFDESSRCSEHPHAVVNTGYGLAGGGIGVYTYCSVCWKTLSKSQDTDG